MLFRSLYHFSANTENTNADAMVKDNQQTGKVCQTDAMFVKHSEFYFPDGNIVISARPDSDKFGTHSTGDGKREGSRLVDGGDKGETGESVPNERDDADKITRMVLFKVHRSVLASNSKIFTDMFSISDHGSESFDGIPLVHMPDPAEDIEVLIDTIYGSSFTRL